LSNKHLDEDPRLYPCDNEYEKKLAKRKERISITENQPQASSKLKNQSIMGIGSSPQDFKTNLGGERQNDSLHQNLQELSQAGHKTQCD
jgi:hypothetical protein